MFPTGHCQIAQRQPRFQGSLLLVPTGTSRKTLGTIVKLGRFFSQLAYLVAPSLIRSVTTKLRKTKPGSKFVSQQQSHGEIRHNKDPSPLRNLEVLTYWRKLTDEMAGHNIPSLLSRCLDSVERNVIFRLYFSSLEYMIQKAVKIVQKNLGHNDSVRCIIHIPERSQVLLWNYSFAYLFVIFCLDLRGETGRAKQ